MTDESLQKEVHTAIALIINGGSLIKRIGHKNNNHNRDRYNRGYEKMSEGISRLKTLKSQAGRLRKKMINEKRRAKIVTLTEINGVSWRIRVPR